MLSTEDLAGLDRETQITLVLLILDKFGIDEPYGFCGEVYPDGDIVTFGGIEYPPIPWQIDGQKLDSRGQLATPTLTIGELTTESSQLAIGAFVRQYDDLVGATVKVFTTYAKHLDAGADPDPTAILTSETYTIERKKSASRIGYTFELSTGISLQGAKIPKRQVTNNCSWPQYRGEGCAYTGSPVDDANGNPLIPVRVTGCTFSGNQISNTVAFSTGIEPGDAVIGAGVPVNTRVLRIADDRLSMRVSKPLPSSTGVLCWFTADPCARLRINCKRRFGVERQGVITPGSNVITSPPSARGQFASLSGHYVQCSNLAAGLPVARRILSVGNGNSVNITSVTFQNASGIKRWIFTTASQITANTVVTIANVHSLINGTYVLASDSFTGLLANQFSILAKPQDITSIVTGTPTTTITTIAPHGLAIGNTILIEGTNPTGVDINGTRTVTAVDSPTVFRINFSSAVPYQSRARVAFATPEYMAQFRLGDTVLNSVTAPNQEGVFFFATNLTPPSATVTIVDDTVVLDQPIDASATAGTYTLIVGGEKVSGILNFGGQPGAAVVNF